MFVSVIVVEIKLMLSECFNIETSIQVWVVLKQLRVTIIMKIKPKQTNKQTNPCHTPKFFLHLEMQFSTAVERCKLGKYASYIVQMYSSHIKQSLLIKRCVASCMKNGTV